MNKSCIFLFFIALVLIIMPDLSPKNNSQRRSQRDLLPYITKPRNLDVIAKTTTISSSVTLAAGADTVFSMTTASRKGVPIFVQEDISLFETSVSAANLIPNGTNIDMADYQIIGPWREQDSGDGKNIVTKIYIRNTSAVAATDFTKRVAASNDDASQSSLGVFLTENFLLTGNGGAVSGDITNGVRFNSVTVPQGETINSATLTFKASTNDSTNVLTKIYGIDEDDAVDFNTTPPESQTKTTASVDWDLNGIVNNTEYATSDISSLVQEIVDRAGWVSGNDMGFIIVDDGSAEGDNHSFDAYDGSSSEACLLSINYGGGVGESKTILFRGQTRYISPINDVTIE